MIASVGSSMSFVHVAAQMRRLFGNIGSVKQQDALVTHDMETASDDDSYEAWVA